MARIKLTAAFVSNKAVCEKGKYQTFFWDTEVPGLALRVTQSGQAAFIFQGRVNRIEIRITIGDTRVWRLDAPAGSNEPNARAEARRLQAMCDDGIDPRAVKAEKKVQAVQAQAEKIRKSVTVQEAWLQYLDYLKTSRSPKTGKLRSERYLRDHVNLASEGGKAKKRGHDETVAGPLASLMHMPLNKLTPETISEWLAHESTKRPTVAAHAYRLLRAFITWLNRSEFQGVVSPDACTNGKVKEQLPRSEAREGDALQREMLKPWFDAIFKNANPIQAAYLVGLLLTGARREELAHLKWSDVDFRWRSLRIADKIESERTIPLPPYLCSLINALPRQNEWVFSSLASSSGRIQEPRIAHNRALNAAGLPHVSLHGLRRSFSTFAEWSETPSGVIAQIMGHKPSAIAEKHYRRRPLDLLRLHHDKIEKWILEQAQIQQPEFNLSNLGLRVIS